MRRYTEYTGNSLDAERGTVRKNVPPRNLLAEWIIYEATRAKFWDNELDRKCFWALFFRDRDKNGRQSRDASMFSASR